MKQIKNITTPDKPSATLASNCNLWLNNMLFISIVFMFLSVNFALGQNISGKTFVIAPGGKDNNPGTMSLPLATLEAARDAARAAGVGTHRIVIMPGDYYLTKSVELDSRDNGLTIEADTSGKVILYGGSLVTGWRRDGDKFWCADLPGVKEGNWDFRSVVVNGRMPERARMPESGTLKYLNVFDVAWLTSIGGGWARKPTQEELTTLRYDPKDIPETLDIRNAEVRVFHSWDESLVGVSRNDIQQHALIFSKPTAYPPGGFGRKDYIVYNTREGMTKAGQWYLDRTNGRLVYWPMEGEDMNRIKVIAPRIERIIRIAGDQEKKAENITIRGLGLQATAMPFKSAGMGAISFDGASSMTNAQNCVLEKLEICNAGGIGISASQISSCRITDCHIYNIGGGGARIEGSDIFFARNHVHNVGIYSPSAIGLSVGGSRNHIYRNEIHDVPYSGMIVGRADILIEENLIYRVMLELHDGGAIYTFGVSNCIMRGNVIRDIKTIGQGTAAFGYYLDEGSKNCIVENNVAIGLSIPTHNHIAINSIIRNNVFINDEDMTLSFQSSAKMTFQNNTLITPGRIRITAPNAVTTWKDNKIVSNGRDKNNLPQAYSIDSAMPFVARPSHKTRPIDVIRSVKAPVLDGIITTDEWSGTYQRLDRLPSRWSYNGAPVMVKFSHDNKFLYIGAMLTMFDNNNISMGDKWEKDDGVEISVQGFDKGKAVTYVIRTYVNGTVQSVTDAGVSAVAAERLRKGVKYATKVMERPGRGWIGEWAIPLDALGIKPKTDMKIPFNMCAFINEYDKWHCWEGTQGENWEVDKAGVLLFK
jgi:hypothetical protein